MGTTPPDGTTKKIDCPSCGQQYTPMCNYRQGRCPYHPAMFNTSAVKTRFTNLINFLKGK
jgi:hypothetical protein